MPGFHNPYNFIPAADRNTDDPHLGDRKPTGHARLHPDLWTGTIDITLTTVTPLLIPDKGQEDPKTKHKTFDTRVVNGRVDLPSTTVKGALRASYEAVTNSRMGVFVHNSPLGYRSPAQAGLKLRPVLVKLDAQGSPVGILTTISITHVEYPEVLPAVAIPTYSLGEHRAITLINGGHVEQGQKISTWAELVFRKPKGEQAGYHYWRAAQAWRSGVDPDPERPASLGDAKNSTTNHVVVGPWALIRGVVHRTNRNMSGKHDERLFPLQVGEVAPDVVVGQRERIRFDPEAAQEVWKRYLHLLADYVATHKRGRRDDIWDRPRDHKPWDSYRVNAGRRTKPVYAWSRHLYQTDAAGQGNNFTQPGAAVTCYAIVETVEGKEADQTKKVVTALYPVLISRGLYAASPADLLPRGVEPAVAINEASPADRMFGWVSQCKAAPDDDAAFQGALRVGPITGPEHEHALDRFDEEAVRLDILSSPKPTQGRFYVGQKRDGRAVPFSGRKNKTKVYDAADGQVLRGRKVYPHQPHLDTYWTATKGQEFRRPDGQADDQNRSILSWVKPGMEFRTTLHLRNLTNVELGALLLVLTPEEFGTQGQVGLHRMGGASRSGSGRCGSRSTASTCVPAVPGETT
ncbi:TIGR03986 family type III CRISPR-associated RAMP protein [Actinokineospora sp. G85]|uniref:TIGR03986 family type III CRISPR-associated RAMP protein n=1 Tax=Actinokineospora sp. G85 TaxID=3406626 RepID=UPI003C788F8E